jgi:CheY-like chemotaxis protein
MHKDNPIILVVEDEKSLLKAWAEIFRREGLNVLTASYGQSALNLALRWHPDLLVVDLVMAHSDCLTLIKKLRENKWGQNVPVMFLSGWLASEIYEDGSAATFHHQDYYLDNNWSFSQVVGEVRNKLKLPQFNSAATLNS